MKTKENQWYIYTCDDNGEYVVLIFDTREELADNLLHGDFVDWVMPNITDAGKKELEKITEEFQNLKLDNINFGEQLLSIIEDNESEILILSIDDFESVCTGKTELSTFAIRKFSEKNGTDNLKTISEAKKTKFLEFFKSEIHVWFC